MEQETGIEKDVKEEESSIEVVSDSSKIQKVLSQALADEDLKSFKETLKVALHAHGKVSCLAKDAGLSRGTLYKAMQEGSDTGLGTLLKLFHALGLELVVTKRSGKAKRNSVREPSRKNPIWKSLVSFFSRGK